MHQPKEFASLLDQGLRPKNVAQIVPTSLLGTWTNCNQAANGIVKLIITAAGTGIRIHSFGACVPSPCDWGQVAGIVYAADVSSHEAVAFTATYEFAFKVTIVVGHLDAGSLVVETLDRFTDGSGRSNYYSRCYMCKCTGAATSPWPIFHQNVRRTGQSAVDTSANSGALKWSYKTGDPNLWVEDVPALGPDGTVYCALNNTLFAIDAAGSLKWTFTTNAIDSEAPAVGADGTVYVGAWANPSNFFALNPDGTLKWSFACDYNSGSSPAIGADGAIFFGAGTSLNALNPDGSLRWSYAIPPYGGEVESTSSSPAIGDDGTIYIADDGGNLYAVNPDGTLKWTYPTGDYMLGSSFAIASDGTLYVGTESGGLYALNPDGSVKWRFAEVGIDTCPSVAADGTVYAGTMDGDMCALKPDGSVKWRFPTGSPDLSSPAIGADGTVYFGSYVGNMYAVNPDGSLKWRFATPPGKLLGEAQTSSPAIGADGTLYFGCSDGTLYALR